jgi:hypothetical protein
MTDENGPKSSDEKAAPPRVDEQRIRSILRSARFSNRTPSPDLLSGVQRRIRERSRGKFYGDGWSRSRAPTSTYVVTSLLMLVILVLVYFVLIPSLPVP